MISISLYHKSLKVFKSLNYSQPIPLAYQISWASRKRTHLKWLFKAFVLAKNNFHHTRKILNIFEWNISFIDLRATWEALKTGQLLLETGRNNQYITVFLEGSEFAQGQKYYDIVKHGNWSIWFLVSPEYINNFTFSFSYSQLS